MTTMIHNQLVGRFGLVNHAKPLKIDAWGKTTSTHLGEPHPLSDAIPHPSTICFWTQIPVVQCLMCAYGYKSFIKYFRHCSEPINQ